MATLSVEDIIAGEGDGFVDVVVRLSAPVAGAVTVNYTTSNGSANGNGTDFTGISGGLSFAAGETTKVVRVLITNNGVAESLEHFYFSLSTPVNATIAKAYAFVGIADNDTVVGTPQLFVRDVTVDEKAGTASFVVMLGNNGGQSSASAVTVDYNTANGTATAGSDYTATAGTLSFAPGESVKTVVVPITDDASAEGVERLTLTLSNASNATIVEGTGVGTIGASDANAVALPRISVGPDMVVGEADGYIDVVVSLSAPGQNAVSVNYTTSNASAGGNGTDYHGISGTLNFAVGETTKVVRVQMTDDEAVEPLESFYFSLSTPTNATIAREYALVGVADGDAVAATPQLFVRDIVVDEKAGTASFVVLLGNAGGQGSNSLVTVDYTTANGTALAGSDYLARGGTLAFAPGESTKTVVVDITDDAVVEGVERFSLALSNASGASIVDGVGLAEIGANDSNAVAQPRISIGPDMVVGEADGYFDIVVGLSAPGQSQVSVNYSTFNETAGGNATDFFGLSGTLVFAPGETTKLVRVQLVDGATPEALEHFYVSLSTPTNATIARGSAVVSIADNDTVVAAPSLFVRDVVVDEKAGTASFVVTLGLNGGQSSNSLITVDYATSNATATAGSDYLAQSGTLTFAPGESSKTVVVDITDDALAEGFERFNLTLSNASGANIVKGVGVAEISANDAVAVAQPRISVEADRVIGESEGYVDFVVRLSAPGQSVVSVNYSTFNETAAGNSTDFVGQSGSLVFAPGETSKVVRVPILDALTAEALETFYFTINTPTNATIARNSAVVAIADNDTVVDEPRLFVRDIVVDEKAGTASFVVTLGLTGGESSNSTITVDYSTANAGATAGSDYVAKNGTLTFAPGESVKTVVVDISDDALAEGLERFTLNLSNASNATIVKGVGVAEIGPNDAVALAQPKISVADVVVGENEGYLDFTVSLSAPGQNLVSVNYTTNNLSAGGNSTDYVGQSGTINFALGETTKTVRVQLIDGLTPEALEHFSLSLNTPTNATIAKNYAMASIVDNDTVVETPSLFVRDVVVDEKAGTASFVVMLGVAGGESSNSTITVDYNTANATALAGSDYAARSGTLTFAPGESVKTVVVDISDDALAEGFERFSLNLSNANGATIVKGVGLGEIAANDGVAVAQPRLFVADQVLGEGDGYADVVVSLSAPGQSVISVNYATGNASAGGNGTDYYALSDTLNFAIGETTKVVRVPLVDGSTAEALEHFYFSLSTPTNATIADAYAQVAIVDNDTVVDTPQFYVRDAVVDETEGRASFVVMLGATGGQSSNSTITVDYTTADASATGGSDFVARSGTLTFAPGESVKTVVVDISDDASAEGLERVNLVLSNAVNASIADGNAVAVISAGDTAAVALPVISAADATVSEHDGFIDLVVQLSAPGASPVSVNYTTANVTAGGNGSDYTGVSGTLNFATGETLKVVRVFLADDVSVEALETFRLNFSTPVNATIGTAFSTYSLVDDDTAGVEVMSFGISDDIYPVDDAADVIIENVNGGVDLVLASVSYTLPTNVENGRIVVADAINLTGNELGNLLYSGSGDNILDGAGGTDTVSYAFAESAVTVSLALAGAQATSGAGSDTLLNIENLDGSGFDDTLSGDAAANVVSGAAGNDTIDGGAGIDTLVGGAGSDTYTVDVAGDVIVETDASPGTGGTDLVLSAVSFTLSANVEQLRLTGSGSVNATGNAQDNVLFANAGNNLLDGAGGIDTASYAFAGSAVAVSLALVGAQTTGGSGSDALLNIENLTGSGLADRLTGNAGANVLDGGVGNDTLEGGAGNDNLIGAAGSDTASYAGAVAGVNLSLAITTAQATGAAGSDTLGGIENLTGGNFADTLSGDVAGNVLNGGGGSDTLDGGAGADVVDGGSGADNLIGGLGSDNLYIDNAGDVVIEADATAAGGIDTVYASVSVAALWANVENVRIVGAGALDVLGNGLNNLVYAGAGDNVIDGANGIDTVSYVFAASAVNVSLDTSNPQATGGSGSDTLRFVEYLTGSNFNDTLSGNAGFNTLDGGAGADTLSGGAADDNYFVDNAGDAVIETDPVPGFGGRDTVYASVSYTLPDNVENLRLVPATAINATGNALDNILYAGNGNNVLDGAAGIDLVSYAFAPSAVTLNLATVGAQATGSSGSDTLLNVEGVSGSSFNDNLTGTAGGDLLYGGAGVDTLTGAAGDDVLDGQAGADSLVGGDGNDNYTVDDALDLTVETNASIAVGGIDTAYTYVNHTLQTNVENARILEPGAVNLTGNALNNTIWAGRGNNVIDAGAGNDTVSYLYQLGGVRIDLGNAGPQATLGSGSDTLLNIENVTGSNFADNLTGTAGANVIDGGLGADILIGLNGNDLYYVDNAADNIIETLTGGIDLVYATATYTLAANVESLRQISGDNINATGNTLNNTIYAGTGNNVLDGAAGSDTISFAYATAAVTANFAIGLATGGSGSDTLSNFENLIGSGYADTLTGNAAANTLTGGTGADIFVLNGVLASDTITDFASGSDKVRISQAGIPVGNGDAVVNGATAVAGPGGFATSAELVLFTGNIAGALTAASAAAAIGSANSAYGIGAKSVFVVDNGTSSAAYLFTAADANAAVSAAELTLLATLSNTAATTTADWIFGT